MCLINANALYNTQISFASVDGTVCALYLIVNDGIYFREARDIGMALYLHEIILMPGSRADVAMKCKFVEEQSRALLIRRPSLRSSGSSSGESSQR